MNERTRHDLIGGAAHGGSSTPRTGIYGQEGLEVRRRCAGFPSQECGAFESVWTAVTLILSFNLLAVLPGGEMAGTVAALMDS